MKEVHTMYITKRDNSNRIIDEFFRDPFWGGSFEQSTGSGKIMKTDVKEKADRYTLSMELPGIAKEDIKVELKEGYLTVTATKSASKEDSEEGKYIRKERFEGSCKRTFYVGDYASDENVTASYTDGVLFLDIPKQPEPMPEQPKMITIN